MVASALILAWDSQRWFPIDQLIDLPSWQYLGSSKVDDTAGLTGESPVVSTHVVCTSTMSWC